MALRSELENLAIGHPLVVMNEDERGHVHDLKATFQGLTKTRVKIRYLAGAVNSHCLPRKVIIKHYTDCCSNRLVFNDTEWF